jgi:hypothetical protein
MQALKRIRFITTLVLGACMILSFTDMIRVIPAEVKGVVVSGPDKKPVAKAYVVVVPGEEEALTDANGNFTLRTWQSLPVTLTVQHTNYQTRKVQVSDTQHTQLIQLDNR